jgi:hypothetical protein
LSLVDEFNCAILSLKLALDWVKVRIFTHYKIFI